MPPDADTSARLSGPARLALSSLEERPNLSTLQAISSGPFSLEQLSAEDFAAGLRELEAANLAFQDSFGWHLARQNS